MGGCLSWAGGNTPSVPQKPTANVISLHGELRQYTVPVTASQVLHMEASSSTSSSSSSFLCNSDCLHYDDYIPPLDPTDELQGAQIYFVLPTTKLQYRLRASDMAALAVKASLALQSSSSYQYQGLPSHRHKKKKKKNPNNNNKARISPGVLEVNQLQLQGVSSERDVHNKSFSDKPVAAGGLVVSRSGSVRKLRRYYSSSRAKMVVRSFRVRLTTIYEGSVPVFY